MGGSGAATFRSLERTLNVALPSLSLHLELHAQGSRRFLQRRQLGLAVARICDDGHAREPRHKLFEQRQFFCVELRSEQLYAGGIPARFGEADDEPSLHHFVSQGDDWNRRGRSLDRPRGHRSNRCDDLHIQIYQLGGELSPMLYCLFSASEVDSYHLALEVAPRRQALTESLHSGSAKGTRARP